MQPKTKLSQVERKEMEMQGNSYSLLPARDLLGTTLKDGLDLTSMHGPGDEAEMKRLKVIR